MKSPFQLSPVHASTSGIRSLREQAACSVRHREYHVIIHFLLYSSGQGIPSQAQGKASDGAPAISQRLWLPAQGEGASLAFCQPREERGALRYEMSQAQAFLCPFRPSSRASRHCPLPPSSFRAGNSRSRSGYSVSSRRQGIASDSTPAISQKLWPPAQGEGASLAFCQPREEKGALRYEMSQAQAFPCLFRLSFGSSRHCSVPPLYLRNSRVRPPSWCWPQPWLLAICPRVGYRTGFLSAQVSTGTPSVYDAHRILPLVCLCLPGNWQRSLGLPSFPGRNVKLRGFSGAIYPFFPDQSLIRGDRAGPSSIAAWQGPSCAYCL